MNPRSNTAFYESTHYPAHYQLRLAGGSIVFALLVFGLLYSISTRKYNFGNLFELMTLPITLIYLVNSRIVTSLNGITYYHLGYSIQASWNNVIAIEQVRKGDKQVDVLLLKESILNKTPFLSLARFYDPITDLEKDVQAISFGKAIPLTWFDDKWKESELGQELRQFIPGVIAWKQNNS